VGEVSRVGVTEGVGLDNGCVATPSGAFGASFPSFAWGGTDCTLK